MDDVRAVMDAVGSKRAALCGVSEGGAMAALFAATYPERTAALVMIGSYAKRIRDASYPWGPTEAQREEFLEEIARAMGRARGPGGAGPLHGRQSRVPPLVGGVPAEPPPVPAAAVALTRMNSEADIRSILPAIRVPTLVAHRTGDQCLLVEEGRYLAEPDSRARALSNSPGWTTCPSWGTRTPSSMKWRSSSPECATRRAPSPSWRRYSRLPSNCRRTRSQPAPRVWQRLRDHIDRELEWARGRDCSPGTHSLLASFDGPARAIRCASRDRPSRLQDWASACAPACISESAKSLAAAFVAPQWRLPARSRKTRSADEILVSATVRDLVAGSGIRFRHEGNSGLPVGIAPTCRFWQWTPALITNPLPNPYDISGCSLRVV